jgi:hypothetical protein
LSDIIVGAPNWKFSTREGYWGIFLGDRRITTSVKEKPSSNNPYKFLLSSSFPNPFSVDTQLNFSLAEPSQVVIRIYNMNGQLVRSLLNDSYAPGNYIAHWNGTDQQGREMPNGIYFLKMFFTQDKATPNVSETRKLVLIR